MRELGYDTSIQEEQYMPHVHAIIGPLNEAREAALKVLIEKSVGKPLIPGQLQFKSLHANKSVSIQAQAHLAATLRSVGWAFAKSEFPQLRDKGATMLNMHALCVENLYERVLLEATNSNI
jgi:hypothetical protein